MLWNLRWGLNQQPYHCQWNAVATELLESALPGSLSSDVADFLAVLLVSELSSLCSGSLLVPSEIMIPKFYDVQNSSYA